jgi:hypothetical protein
VSDEATRGQAAAAELASGAAAAVNAGAWPPGGAPGQAGELVVAGQRPEVAVAAAFGGGLLAAILLRRLASGD